MGKATLMSLAILLGLFHGYGGQAAPVISFGPAIPVSDAGSGRAMAPDVAVGPDGSVHLIWVAKLPVPAGESTQGPSHAATDELWYRRLPAGGGIPGPLVRVNQAAGEVWGFAVSRPELDVDARGRIHVLYPANAVQAGSGKGILVARYTRSVDGGASFAPARTLNSAATNDLSAVMHGGFAAAHAFGTLIATGDEVQAFWIDTRGMAPEDSSGALYRAVSRDGGGTFGPDEPVYPADVCPCCQLSAAAEGGQVHLGSRMTFAGGLRDGAVGTALGPGAPFGDRIRVGEGRWQIDGCPLKRVAVAADSGRVYAVSFTGGREPAGVYFAQSRDGGRHFDPAWALQPEAAVSDAPTVAAGQGRVYVAWHAKTGGGRRLYLRVSTDAGATFSDPVEVPTPAGTSAYPELDLSPDGSAWLAWQQDQAAYVMPVTVGAAGATPTVTPLQAEEFRGVLEDHKGQVVLVNFWATWCRPCLKELPELMALEQRLKAQGLVLVPVSLDDPADLERVVRPFLARWFPTLVTYVRVTPDMDSLVSVIDPAWNEVLPTSYVLDRQGQMVVRLQGGKAIGEFEAAVLPLLVPGPAAGAAAVPASHDLIGTRAAPGG